MARRGMTWLGMARIFFMKGNRLKSYRKALGLSLAEASAQVHVTSRTWCRWEKGERKIPESVSELFCRKNKIKYPPD